MSTEDETRLSPDIGHQLPFYTHHILVEQTSTTPLQKLNNLHNPLLFNKDVPAAEIIQ